MLLTQVEGMKLKEGEKADPSQQEKVDSISETVHKVTVLTPYSYTIGDTRKYEKYEGNGIAKQLRQKVTMSFKPFKEVMISNTCEDMNLMGFLTFAEKEGINIYSHIAFEALDKFKLANKAMPKAWDLVDAVAFVKIAQEVAGAYADHLDAKVADWKRDGRELSFFYQFAFQSQGVFNPICAFFGGYVA